jgi:hypothetical protein
LALSFHRDFSGASSIDQRLCESLRLNLRGQKPLWNADKGEFKETPKGRVTGTMPTPDFFSFGSWDVFDKGGASPR